MRFVPALCFALIALLSISPVCAQLGAVAGVHDPAIARVNGNYYVFSTGGGVQIRKSRDLITWERAGRVFEQLPEWAMKEVPGARGPWAPDVSFFNGRWHLYYSVSTYGSRRSCIGLATNVTLDPADANYRWVDHGMVLETRQTDDWNAIDANVVLDESGTPWLSLGSFWGGLKIVRLDASTGMPSKADGGLRPIARRPKPGAIEAPFIIRRGEFYYLFASFDYCCKRAESTYNIRVGRSRAVVGPYVDRDGKPMLEGGGTMVVQGAGTIRGPGHNAVLQEPDRDWLVHHFYDAADAGRPKLQVRPMTWDEAGWPVAGEPVAKPPPTTAAATTTTATSTTTTQPGR